MYIGKRNIAELSSLDGHICILLFPFSIEISWKDIHSITFHIFDYSLVLTFRVDENYFLLEED